MEPSPTIGEVVRARRERLGMTQVVLADLIGKPQTYISQLEVGKNRRPDQDVIRLLANALRMDVGPLLEAAGWLVRVETAERHIPVMGRIPADTIRFSELGVGTRMLSVTPEEVAGARSPFALEVSGSCMAELGILDGDVIICDRPLGRQPRDRQLAVVRVNGDEVGLKRWCVTPHGIELRDGAERVVYTLGDADEAEILGLYLTFRPGPR